MQTLFALLMLLTVQSPAGVTAGKAYKFEKIADGVYYATSTGAIVTGSNNVLIVGDRDVLVVDTGTSPAAAPVSNPFGTLSFIIYPNPPLPAWPPGVAQPNCCKTSASGQPVWHECRLPCAGAVNILTGGL